jgi:pimeloyl-ACP methyl ester carboxylesterase
MQINANGVMLEVEDYGPKDGPPVILIRGLGTQLVHWVPEMYEGLAARGYRTIIFDNRDVGLSQKFGRPDQADTSAAIRAAIAGGEVLKPAYGLDDMAADVVGLMDVLGIARAHVFGISMGGGIAQILAVHHTDRLLSATMVMTAAHFGGLDRVNLLLSDPRTRDVAVDAGLAEDRMWGSPGFPRSDDEVVEMAGRAWDRDHDETGINRHVLATASAGDRRPDLPGVGLPCLVIHGTDDTLVPPDKGRQIAALIPGARLEIVDGMGHVITPALAPLLVDMVDGFIRDLS